MNYSRSLLPLIKKKKYIQISYYKKFNKLFSIYLVDKIEKS